jgi:3-hydroxybutyrate dehydrogenase
MTQSKAALITGSTGGIGSAIAEALAAAGHAIMLNGFGDADDIEALRAGLAERHGVTVDYHGADMTQVDQVEAMVVATDENLGGVDILINCAGIQIVGALDEIDPSVWHRIIDINLNALYHTTRHALPRMKAKGWGRIVNFASTHGLVASPFKVPYIAAKHGVVGLTKGTAMEVGAFGITCNAICPGFTRTSLVESQAREIGDRDGRAMEDVLTEQVSEKHVTGRAIEVEEVAALTAFLCSDAAKSITGTAIPIDGGWTAN